MVTPTGGASASVGGWLNARRVRRDQAWCRSAAAGYLMKRFWITLLTAAARMAASAVDRARPGAVMIF